MNTLYKIHTLELGFQSVSHAIAAYLIEGPEGPLLVESGPGSTLVNLQNELAKYGFSPPDIKHVLVTHIHLDHAGAAGWWAQQGAQVYVHYFGAHHLIDPGRLLTSARRIYGNEMDPLWGQILPAPAEKVTAVHDRDVINVCGLSFTAIETPGHARHHHVYQLGDIAFVGDAAGIKLPGCDLIDLPAPPPEFDLDVWTQTVDLLIAKSFTTIYPTHYGPVENVEDHLISVKNLLMEAAVLVRDKMADGVDRDELVAQYTAWSRGRARMLGLADKVINQYETVNPLYMSVDGIMRYWRKRSEM